MRTENQPIEQLHSFPALSLEETNRIQMELGTEEGIDLDEWIQENSAQFRAIIENHPELTELYHQKPEEFKKRIKELLKLKPTLH